MYCGVPCKSSFKAGFKAGYRFANCGGDACQPPGPSHFWSAGGMTEQDQRDARAWCDGFTHGTLAAQQDGNAMASGLDAQTAQPHEGVPDVYYYSGPGGIGAIGSSQGMGEFAQGQAAPAPYFPGQFPPDAFSPGTTPFANSMTAPNRPGPSPWSTAAAPADVAYPSAAPPPDAIEVRPGNAPTSSTHYLGSPAFPGIGSLRAPISAQPVAPSNPERSGKIVPTTERVVAAPLPPAPIGESSTRQIPPPYAGTAPTVAAPKSAPEAIPSTQPAPSISSAPAPQWETPIIRN
jgi:hypothetical protein